MKGIWLVTFINDSEYYAFSTREQAYNFIVNEFKNSVLFRGYYISELISELTENYDLYPDCDFGIYGLVNCTYVEIISCTEEE